MAESGALPALHPGYFHEKSLIAERVSGIAPKVTAAFARRRGNEAF